MGQVSIITGVERRRAWGRQQKLDLVAEAFGAGSNVAEVARRANICTSLLYRWRRSLSAGSGSAAFVPAVIAHDTPASLPTSAVATAPAIIIELPGRATVRIGAEASPALVAAALGALR